MADNVDANSALNQFYFVIEQIERYTLPSAPKFLLTSELISQLHAVSFANRSDAGRFRTAHVAVAGSPHEPPSPKQIADEVKELCDYINGAWERQGALHLAAFVLWKLNWTHPFLDGNGRTARALSYLVLSVRFGAVLPGVPTIPEQLRHHRSRYFDALQAADVAFQERKTVDVTLLEVMLHDMLVHQLSALASLPEEEELRLREVVDRRVRRLPGGPLLNHFGSQVIAERLWAVGDHLVLQIGPLSAIQQAERMQASFGSAFPRLLSEDGAAAGIQVRADQGALVLRQATFDASCGFAVAFERNAAAVIEHPRASIGTLANTMKL